nr:MAG: hypothetical protein DIU60_20315 [Actinomycetota bacterium]
MRRVKAALADNGPVVILAVIAAVGSFDHISHLAARYGQTGWRSWAVAVCIDLMCVMAARERQRDKRLGRRPRGPVSWPTLVLAGGITLTLAANLAQAHPSPWGWIVAGTPAGAFLIAVSMLERRAAHAHQVASPVDQARGVAVVDTVHRDVMPDLQPRGSAGAVTSGALGHGTAGPLVEAAPSGRPVDSRDYAGGEHVGGLLYGVAAAAVSAGGGVERGEAGDVADPTRAKRTRRTRSSRPSSRPRKTRSRRRTAAWARSRSPSCAPPRCGRSSASWSGATVGVPRACGRPCATAPTRRRWSGRGSACCCRARPGRTRSSRRCGTTPPTRTR